MIRTVKRKPLFRAPRQNLKPAIGELMVSLNIMNTNAPINEKEGHFAQARLERTTAKSVKAAIGLLEKPI